LKVRINATCEQQSESASSSYNQRKGNLDESTEPMYMHAT